MMIFRNFPISNNLEEVIINNPSLYNKRQEARAELYVRRPEVTWPKQFILSRFIFDNNLVTKYLGPSDI